VSGWPGNAETARLAGRAVSHVDLVAGARNYRYRHLLEIAI